MKKLLAVVFAAISVTLALSLVGCDYDEVVEAHIDEPIAMTGDLAFYAGMDEDERESGCKEKHIEVSGAVTYVGSILIEIGDRDVDGLWISCMLDDFDDDLGIVEKGDYVTIHGVCTDSFSDSMYLYGCQLTNVAKESGNAIGAATEEAVGREEAEAQEEFVIAKAPLSNFDCEGKHYSDVVKAFENAGFTNVKLATAEVPHDANRVEGEVIAVALGDDSFFEVGDECNPDVLVVVGYAVKMAPPAEEPPVETAVSTPEKTERMVWIPQSGSKYHSRSGCSNMKNPTQVTETEAKNMGYTACKKC